MEKYLTTHEAYNEVMDYASRAVNICARLSESVLSITKGDMIDAIERELPVRCDAATPISVWEYFPSRMVCWAYGTERVRGSIVNGIFGFAMPLSADAIDEVRNYYARLIGEEPIKLKSTPRLRIEDACEQYLLRLSGFAGFDYRSEWVDPCVKYMADDVEETADPDEWSTGDVAIAFRRYLVFAGEQLDTFDSCDDTLVTPSK